MINRKHQDSRLNPSNINVHVKGLNIPTTSSNSNRIKKQEGNACFPQEPHKQRQMQNGRKEKQMLTDFTKGL